jgi:hypothetical protein
VDETQAVNRRALLLLIAFGFLGSALFFGYLWLTAPSNQISEESFRRLRVGMTEMEVDEVFGVPPGDYEIVTKETRSYPSTGGLFIPRVPATEKVWRRGGLIISVWFDDAAGKVIHSRMRGEWSESFLDKLRRYLRFSKG